MKRELATRKTWSANNVQKTSFVVLNESVVCSGHCLSFAVRKKTEEQENEQRGATNFEFHRDVEKIKSNKKTSEKVERKDCKVPGDKKRLLKEIKNWVRVLEAMWNVEMWK